MIMFLARRIGAGIVLILVITGGTFWMLSLTNTNTARNVLGPSATAEQVAAKSSELGLDQHWFVQFFDWLGQALQGNLGVSWYSGESVSSALANRVPVTLSVVVFALLISTVISVALGIAAAVRGGWVDRFAQVIAILGFAVPALLFALGLIITLAINLGWFPATGYTTFAKSPAKWLDSITLPALSLAIGAIGATALQIRGSLVDVLATDYIRTLRSRGLSERTLLLQHALRNAAPPALTVLALQFIGMVSGAVAIEKVFGLNGIGTMTNDSAIQGDSPMVMGVILVMAVMVVAVNLLIDIAYGWLNPKVRVG